MEFVLDNTYFSTQNIQTYFYVRNFMDYQLVLVLKYILEKKRLYLILHYRCMLKKKKYAQNKFSHFSENEKLYFSM